MPTCVGCGEPSPRESLKCQSESPNVCFTQLYLTNYEYRANWMQKLCNNGYVIQCQNQNTPDGCCTTIGGSSSCPSNTCIPDE